MKFGKYLAKRQLDLPEYANYFINYKGLKKLIKSLGYDPNNKNARLADIETTLQAHKVTFFFRIERELEKVNTFYLQKEAELKLRLAALLDKKKSAKSKHGAILKTSATFIALHEGFFRFRRDLDKLEQFVELNATGFSKVLKKWDKRSQSQTKELYLSTAVEVQPVFHRDEIAELSDLVSTSLLELDAWADGEDVSFDHRMSDVTQIERTNEELDVEFLRNIAKESEQAVLEWVAHLVQAPDAHERVTKIFLQAISGDANDATVRALYDTGRVNLSYTDEVNDRTVLHEAAISGRMVVLDIMLAHPQELAIDASATDIYGRTALHYACIHGRETMLRPLLAAGAPIDALDQDNFTALLFAVSQEHCACVEELISCGARIDPASEQDYIPLSTACQKGFYDITEVLLKSKAAIIADAEGLYPQHLIAQAGHYKLIPLLKAYGADINMVDKLSGWIALFYAASEGHVQTVKELIKAGADLHFTDKKKLSPLYYSAWEGHIECMRLLLAASGGLSNETALPIESESIPKSVPVPAVEDVIDMDMDTGDVDLIPDLSLPPPILPLRRYGHNFLDKKTFVEITFDAAMPSEPAVKFYSDSNMPAARLTVSSKLLDVIPRSLLLPLADDSRTLSFQIDSIDDFTVDFEIFPTFGSRIIAKTTALSHVFKAVAATGKCTLPLFDLRLQVIGDLTFKFNVIKPYVGTPLEITNFDVYWKSTSQVDAVAPAGLAAPSSLGSVLDVVGSVPPGGFCAHDLQQTQVHSFVTASSLSGSYARVFVQLTKDHVPVVYPKWTVGVGEVGVPVCDLSYAQFATIGAMDPNTAARRAGVSSAKDPSEAFEMLYLSYLSLADALSLLPVEIDLDMCIMYPTEAEQQDLNVVAATADLNVYIDSVLGVVFDYARRVRHEKRGDERTRSVVFSSEHPNVCTVLNWKQPNYPVFFSVGMKPAVYPAEPRESGVNDSGVVEDRRCMSLREASSFSSSNNLMGLICSSHLLDIVPALIESIRVSGLVLVAQNTSEHAYAGGRPGIDGVRDEKVLVFNETIEM
ncbi:hypothetical protein V1512DRAFT_260300 [Lipomyces arxii]|uniref:uncharacterized protein n=1 Tax=Lipomyces arxii TaxID=56418 RepID=UPI0034CE0226